MFEDDMSEDPSSSVLGDYEDEEFEEIELENKDSAFDAEINQEDEEKA